MRDYYQNIIDYVQYEKDMNFKKRRKIDDDDDYTNWNQDCEWSDFDSCIGESYPG